MPNDKKNETLEAKLARVKRKAEKRAQVVGGLLSESHARALDKAQQAATELLDAVDEFLGPDDA